MTVTAIGEKSRLHLELDSVAKKQLEETKIATRAATSAEVVRRALALYATVVEHQRDGGVVIFKFRDGSEERLMFL